MRIASTFIILVSFLHLCFLSATNAHSKVLCIDTDKQALLDFKLSFEPNPPSLSTWTNASDDCCDWAGVTCGDHSGHVTELSLDGLKSYKLRPSLLELQYLTFLSFGDSQFTMRIPKFIGSLRKLTSLDLSNVGFFGEIPPHLGNLSMLQYLNIGQSDFGLYSHSLQWLSRLSSIVDLDLNFVNLSNATDWASTLKMLPYSSSFYCRSCSLPPPILSSISRDNFSYYLQTLDLSYNNVSSSAFSYLINGANNLQSVALDYMNLETNLHEFLESLSGNAQSSLEELSLVGSNLNNLPLEATMFPSLTSLDASFNRISGSLPEILQYVPQNISFLDLSSNLLDGILLDAHLSKFSQLTHLTLSHNNLLTFNFSEGWVPPFQLSTLQLRSCKVGPSFPSWIVTQKSLMFLDISDSIISGEIPDVLTHFNYLVGLNLSHNIISSMVQSSNVSLSSKLSVRYIDLSYNTFLGPIPFSLFRAGMLDLSNNKFSSFPSVHHKVASIYMPVIINLSNNHLSGSLPNWLFQFHNLFVLKLENNKLSGTLPGAIGSLSLLTALHLSSNRFTGNLPLSMKNCTWLYILELANNKFSGVVPSWLGESMSHLLVLTLRSNNLSGDLPPSLCHLQNLQLLDLSDNKLSGTILGCVHNFSSMASNKEASINFDPDEIWGSFYANRDLIFLDYASVMWKGKLADLTSKNLEQRNVINLSGNLLRGEIPIGVTTLKELKALDLSRNDLNGSIPDKIGQLTSLEYLKLSSNRLCGEIPQSLGALTFLGTLDLSNNNLSGRIPTSTQLQSFNASSYGGNPKLCGEPLPTKCPGDEDDDNKQPLSSNDARDEDDESFDIQAFLAALGMGFAFGLLIVLGILHFNRPLRIAFFQLGNNIADWIFVAKSLFPSRIKTSLCFIKANERAANM